MERYKHVHKWMIVSIRIKRLHPAILMVGLAHILYFLLKPMGHNETWRRIAEEEFK